MSMRLCSEITSAQTVRLTPISTITTTSIKTWIDTNGNAIAANKNVERNKQIYFRIKNADGKYITVNGTKYSGSYSFAGTTTKATSLYVNPGTGNIIAYLNKGRGIDMNIINTLIASGQIYQGVQYNGLHIVGYNDEGMAFYRFNDNRDWVDYRLQTLRASPTATDTYQAEAVSSKYVDKILLKDNTKIFKNNLVVSTGKNAQGEISYAAFRIASTNYRFRGEVAGSDKASGFLIESEGMNDCVYVFESFIDAMSHANLYNIKYGNKDAWKLHNRLALGGTADTALMELLKRKPNIRNICLCLDNDSAGRAASATIRQKLMSMGYMNVYERFSREKDYNEELIRVRKTEIEISYE
jgi:hypothetical protein